MPTARRATGAQLPPLAPYVTAVSVATAVAAAYFQLPAFAVLLAGLILATLFSYAPAFTGPVESGRPSPANQAEAHGMQAHRVWSDLRWRLLVPNADWLPNAVASLPAYRPSVNPAAMRFVPKSLRGAAGALDLGGSIVWLLLPARLTYFAALGAAALAFTIPAGGFASVNALAAFILVIQVDASRRRNANADGASPIVSITSLAVSKPKTLGILAVSTAVAVAATISAVVFHSTLSPLALLGPATFAVVAATLLHFSGRAAAFEPWHRTTAARILWRPRWRGLKVDPAPFLISRELVGAAQTPVDTFEASGMLGAQGALNLYAKLTPFMGTGVRFALLTVPDVDADGRPLSGSKHPLQFRVVTWAQDTRPDASDPSIDQAELSLFVESAMFWAAAEGLQKQPVLLSLEPIFTMTDAAIEPGTDEITDEPETTEPVRPTTAAWATIWSSSEANVSGILGATVGPVSNALQHQAYADGDILYIGAVTEPTTKLIDSRLLERIEELSVLARWDIRWNDALKQGEKKPVCQYAHRQEAKLNDRTTIYSMPFMVNQGADMSNFFTQSMQGRLRTALKAAPFLTVDSWAGGGRAGDKHAQALVVIWSDTPVPSNPSKIKPGNSQATTWALTAALSDAFDSARLPRPVLIQATALTVRDIDSHIWQMKLRLHDGVISSAVKAASEKLRVSFGCDWLRVTESEDGCTIYAGANPASPVVRFRDPKYKRKCLELDWEQAFIDAKVVSPADGSAPKLVSASTLPKNTKVQSLTFTVPRGLSPAVVKEARPKLRGSTGNVFMEMVPSGDPKTFTLLTCEENPMPFPAPFDWNELLNGTTLPFATGVEGEPIAFDWTLDPHLLVLGGSGSGKSATLQALLTAALIKGCEVYLADPTKGGADFKYAEPWMKAITAETREASAMMTAVYEEVQRRKALNSEYGVASYKDLPAEVRPAHVVVFIDEFTSLMMADKLERAVGDESPDELKHRAEAEAINAAKRNIGSLAGRIAREARSAGVTMVLATQALKADTLKSIPGAGDIKTNMSSIVLGKTSFGQLQSALKEPTETPDLGEDIKRGLGLFESSAFRAKIIQSWYDVDHLASMTSKLEEHVQRLTPGEKLDVTKYMKQAPDVPVFGEIIRRSTGGDSVVDLGTVDVDFDFEAAFGQAEDVVDLGTIDFDLGLDFGLLDDAGDEQAEDGDSDSPVSNSDSQPVAPTAAPWEPRFDAVDSDVDAHETSEPAPIFEFDADETPIPVRLVPVAAVQMTVAEPEETPIPVRLVPVAGVPALVRLTESRPTPMVQWSAEGLFDSPAPKSANLFD